MIKVKVDQSQEDWKCSRGDLGYNFLKSCQDNDI